MFGKREAGEEEERGLGCSLIVALCLNILNWVLIVQFLGNPEFDNLINC